MISFICPVYRKSTDAFNRTIQSLLDQTYKEIEVVAVFDGADQILESHAEVFAKKDKRFRHIVIEHGGASKARNAGFKEAKGDIIWWWDVDCYAVPMMAETWLKYWKDDPEAAFLYSGYKWTDPKMPGFESEEFDPWTIQKYNYISSMSPIKREWVIDWDEDLQGLQDWDYFRRVVKNGGRGIYIPCGHNAVSAAFETEYPDENSISGVKSRERAIERIDKVREKHGDSKPDWLVYGSILKADAVNIAKLMGADHFNQPFWITRDYRGVLLVGFNAMEMDQAVAFAALAGKTAKKVIYWMGIDAEMLAQGPYSEVKKLAEGVNKHFNLNFCPDVRCQNTLSDMGIKAEVLVFPKPEGPILTSLPEKFKVLAFADQENEALLDSVIKAMPDIDFLKVQGDRHYPFKDYSMVFRLTKDARLMSVDRTALLHGRHMISNAQEPYAGFIDTSDVTKFKDEAISQIYKLKESLKFNSEAQMYYLDLMSPERFRAALNSCLLEVIGG